MATSQFDDDLFSYQAPPDAEADSPDRQPVSLAAGRNKRYRERLRQRESVAIPATKKCCTCQNVKPSDQFHKNKSEPDGLATRCKSCKSAEHKATFDKRAAEYEPVVHKFCAGCGLDKPAEEFYRQTAAPSGLTTYCIPCNKARAMEGYQDNREDRILSAWIWQKKNPDRARAQRISLRCNTRARDIGAEGAFSPQEWIDLLEECNRRCAYCNREENPDSLLTADHKIPLSRGGTNWITNIAAACRKCNGAKRDKTPEEFTAWRARSDAILALHKI